MIARIDLIGLPNSSDSIFGMKVNRIFGRPNIIDDLIILYLVDRIPNTESPNIFECLSFMYHSISVNLYSD